MLSEDGLVVELAGGYKGVEDTGKLVGGRCDGLGGPLAVSHATVVVAEGGGAPMEALGCKAQRVGGRMVLPVGDAIQSLVLLTRTADGVERRTLYGVRFVPMTGEAQRR